MRKGLYILLPLLIGCSTLMAQGVQVEFGKNRVQYHRDFDEWSQYESDNFIVYWYGRSRNVGEAAVQIAEYDFEEIQGILEHRINEKVQIVVYADLTDIKQSNIGTEEVFGNTGGQTKIVGNSVFVYYNGNHNDLRRQIREGIASVYLNTMLFGSNLQEIVQNAVLLNLPAWFTDGLVAYIGEPWNTAQDNALRDLMLREKFRDFDRLSEENPRLAGQSLWYYISETENRTTVSNLLYLTRINRSVESGFQYVLGKSFETVVMEWEDYFRQRYREETLTRKAPQGEPLVVKNRRQYPVPMQKISPDGIQLAYSINNQGKTRLYLQDLTRGSRKKIFRSGTKNVFQQADLNYPLFAWNPNGNQLSIIYEHRDNLFFLTYDIYTGKTTRELMSEQYQRIYSMDFVDPFTLVFAADVSGQSDIYLYFPRTRQSQRITNDFYDDLHASAVTLDGNKGIIFASNRTDTLIRPMRRDTILPLQPFDIFYYNIDRDLSELVRITNTPLADERYPVAVDSSHFAYVSDRSGIFNREMGYLEDFVHHYERHIVLEDGTQLTLHADSSLAELDTALVDTMYLEPIIRQRAITYFNSNYDRNIQYQHSASRAGKLVELVPREGKNLVYVQRMQPDTSLRQRPTGFQQRRRDMVNEVQRVLAPKDSLGNNAAPIVLQPTQTDPSLQVEEEMNPGFLFQSEFGNPDSALVKAAAVKEEKATELPENISLVPPVANLNIPVREGVVRPVYKLRPTRLTPYRSQFHTDYVVTQMDNSLLFEGLDQFAANPDGFNVPPPGILLKANVKDLFEDYEFEGGIRVPTTFNGAEYFFLYNNRKHRLDKRFALYMKNQRFNQDSPTLVPRRSRYNIMLGQFNVRYPLDVFRSLRATATIRRDQETQLATDRATYNQPVDNQQRVGLRLEYVFDNSKEIALNLRNGARYKVYAEMMKSFSFGNAATGGGFQFDNGYLGVIGVDARFYQPILRHSVLATRLAGSSSFGNQKILYFLGGVDNWLFPERNDNIPVPPGEYAFQTLAANMRGFPFNTRNGNTYLLGNAELRVPVFRYISRRLQSQLLRNFQLVGFFDVGSAWTGKDPYREDNPLNTSVFEDGNVITVTVNYFRDPIVAGYGIGARTMLFGYFIRADYAWGIETRQIQKPRLHIALGVDF
ncbi:MAG: hypothetical protein H6555_03875 [Lewinellaceae bacterium]|nr:hypothetical protein [Lewinellaceae bacterium]